MRLLGLLALLAIFAFRPAKPGVLTVFNCSEDSAQVDGVPIPAHRSIAIITSKVRGCAQMTLAPTGTRFFPVPCP
jgi:hypothetical protein